ncbi:MAG: hypothetical protein J4O14_06620 [Chloroflexi bacterium]|nr:hypothetical protein [Chloroflexota bacterium]MCI0817927.1 hypothetical protein [Chloroflexota bacterium]MCI0820053.1 hypothetical protein [Chloroflexota bacterium]MCI0839231.1 hypothetical protein [Chloroflexota bacterium]MCI0885639.1 hypothetical protein [Chloroflexota bacterium]
MKFPTVEWFETLEAQAEKNSDTFRRLGFCEALVGVKVLAENGQHRDRSFLLTFNGYSCNSVEEVDNIEQVADFVMEATFGTWKEMIENITANSGPDLSHTLNYLVMPGVPMKVTSADQLKDDVFSRFIGTFQEFFDGAQHVQTEFSG